jgi:flagellar hook-associated protein 1 FlgK
MPGIDGALDIARWSMYSSQLAIEIASHNIANANTEGYSKQNLRLEANPAINMGPGQIGTGVKAVEVTRENDAFLTAQVAQKKSDYAFWKAQNTAMTEVESIFNETGDNGLNALMGEFWSAWGDLANNPDGLPERQSLLSKTDNLLSMVQEVDYNLKVYQRNLDTKIRGSVTDVNSILKQIADLNGNISNMEVKGSVNANDLRDQRDLLLDKLSEHMDITHYEDERSGQVMVFVLGGTPLVMGKDTNTLSTDRDATTGFSSVLWNDSSGRTIDLTDKLKGGDIAGLVNARDSGGIESYLGSLSTLTRELVWQVNSLHSEGVGLQSVSSMTGTVEINDITGPPAVAALDADLGSNFYFSDKYTPGSTFDIIEYDSSGQVAHTYTINPAGDTVRNLIDEINAESTLAGGQVSASLTGGTNGFFKLESGTNTFVIKPSSAGSSGNALAVLGVNTFFSWTETVGKPVHDITETVGVNAALKANPNLISSGYTDNDGKVAPGANDVARAMANLQDKVITNIGGSGVDTTMDSYYSSLVAQVGVDVQNAANNEKFNNTILTQYTQRKESVSGVSLDEEMSDLLKYQHAYQAAAKLISICDEMMQTLLSVK